MVIFPPENFLLEISHPHFCIFIIITVIINIAYVLKMLRLDLLHCIKNISSFCQNSYKLDSFASEM